MSVTNAIGKEIGRQSGAGLPAWTVVRGATGFLLLAGTLVLAIHASWKSNQITEANSRLLLAAAHGDLQEITAALADGAGINARDSDGLTPLIMATRADYPDAAHLLLRRGADVRPCAKICGTALTWAADHGHFDLVGELLHAGADPNVDSGGYCNPLQFCAMMPHDSGAEIARTLIKAGADVHRRYAPGKTAIQCAREADNRPVIDVLIAAGAE